MYHENFVVFVGIDTYHSQRACLLLKILHIYLLYLVLSHPGNSLTSFIAGTVLGARCKAAQGGGLRGPGGRGISTSRGNVRTNQINVPRLSPVWV